MAYNKDKQTAVPQTMTTKTKQVSALAA